MSEQPTPEERGPSPVEEERAERIAQLEARLQRRGTVGVSPFVAATALVGALALLWMQRADAAYFLAPATPITLGSEGDYHFDRAVTNRYAQVRGVPTSRGAWGHEGSGAFVVVGLRDTPLLVKRAPLPGEEWKPGAPPPQPDQRPFTVRGRLLAREDAQRFEADGFTKFEEMGEVRPRWILLEGARPGGDFGAMAWLGGLVGFAGLNLWFLVRGLLALLDARRAPPAP